MSTKEATEITVQTSHTKPEYKPLLWLATGSFAVGTGGFIVAAILPAVAQDLNVHPGTAGLLVTAYSLTYAIFAPLLTIITSRLYKRLLLIGSTLLLAVGNIASALSESFLTLLLTRVIVAMVAGLYVPNANALAGAIASPERRGQALAIVSGGLSVAIAFGVPIGAFIGAFAGWRFSFLAVSGVAVLAVWGLYAGLPPRAGAPIFTTNIREFVVTLRGRERLLSLAVTMLWAMGGYTLYPYLALIFQEGPEFGSSHIALVLFLYGLSACFGLVIGGRWTDRWGAGAVTRIALPAIVVALLSLSLGPRFADGSLRSLSMYLGVCLWALCGWAFYPAQQARLIQLVGIKTAPLILSFNTAFQYVGYAMGAGFGALLLIHGSPYDLGWAGAVAIAAAAGLQRLAKR